MLWIVLVIISSYFVGSIPTAYLFGKVFKGIDIRRFGSGNVGATNALRVLGKTAGITVLLLDIFKGFAVVFFLGNSELLYIILGLVCICGHNWTIFLGFKGGKGMAATLGVLIAMAMKIPGLERVLGAAVLVWLVIFLITRIVSVASIASAVSLPLLMLAFKQTKPLLFLSILLSALIILRHKPNIIRLFQGKEHRISFRK